MKPSALVIAVLTATGVVVTNTAATPATLTVFEVRGADDRLLLRLDGPALVAATQSLDGTSPTAEVPGASALP